MEQKVQTSAPLVNLVDIILLDVNFKRAHVINGGQDISDPNKVKQDIIVNVTHSDLTQNLFAVFLTVDFKISFEEQLIVNAKINQSANFSKAGNPPVDEIAKFANINAPAIIFPFIREMIATLTAKSLVGTVLLQPVNFVQLYNERKELEGSNPI